MQSTITQQTIIGALLAGTALCIGNSAHAALTISTNATSNVACANGVCTATNKNAVLNVAQLESMLASGKVKVSSGPRAKDIAIRAPLAWSSHVLTLHAAGIVAINVPVSSAGTGGLTVVAGGGKVVNGDKIGALSFGPKGQMTFARVSAHLAINGHAYTLVKSIAALANHIRNRPSGFYALAGNYDASVDGIYADAPIPTFSGTLTGLGNTVTKFSLTHLSADQNSLGLIGTLTGTVEHLRLTKAAVRGGHGGQHIGGLIGGNLGIAFEDRVTGNVKGVNDDTVGGLVGTNARTVSNCSASADITGSKGAYVGGLAGVNSSELEESYATGAVRGNSASFASVGGLVGRNVGDIGNSYALGAATGDDTAKVGGLIGLDDGTTRDSYATGAVTGGTGSSVGGFVGEDDAPGGISNSYWDTTTSGITDPSQGAGNVSNDPGITGLTTAQLQSGLPSGFDPSIWGQNPSINNGLPFLIATRP